MKFSIIIPAYNEEAFIAKTLDSLIAQTLQPYQVILVDDSSTDRTALIAKEYAEKHPFIEVITRSSEAMHLPGSKVIQNFNYGLPHLKNDHDILCKYDSDLIFPENYLEKVAKTFQNDPKIGMAGGFCYIEKNGNWVLESLTNKDHIRGALKAYRKECFAEINGLKPAMGWDTIDELLAQYHGWKIETDESLHVKHLKPTGATYSAKAKYKQGEAFYRMRYGFLLTLIASGKLASKKGKLQFLSDYLKGYRLAQKQNLPFLVTEDEGKFIRDLRWKKIRQKLF